MKKTNPNKPQTEDWLSLDDIAEIYGEMLTMDGYDDCIAGICTRFGQEPIIIYDRAKVITRLMNDGMTKDEAEEFHEFNQVGAWMGERTPAFLLSPNDTKLSEGGGLAQPVPNGGTNESRPESNAAPLAEAQAVTASSRSPQRIVRRCGHSDTTVEVERAVSALSRKGLSINLEGG